MGNTTTMSGRFVSVELDGATDWNAPTDLPQLVEGNDQGLMVKSIQIHTTSASDAVIIRNAKTSAQTAAKIMDFLATAEVLDCVRYFGERGCLMWPAMDAADLTEATTVIIELAI